MSDRKNPNIQFVLTVHTSTGKVRQIATPKISDARSFQLSPWIGSGKINIYIIENIVLEIFIAKILLI